MKPAVEDTSSSLDYKKGKFQRFLPGLVIGTSSSQNSQEGKVVSSGLVPDESKERRLFFRAATSKSISGLKNQEVQQNVSFLASNLK
jgi:hypothetical protein